MKWRVIIAGLCLVVGACSDDTSEPVFTSSSAAGSTSTAASSSTATTATTAASTTTVAAEAGPCVFPDGGLTTHIDFDGFDAALGLLGSPSTAAIEAALAADQFSVRQYDHTGWGGASGPITESAARISDNPAAVTPDIMGGLGTSSPPNVLRIFDEGHFSVVAHLALPGQMDYFGFNVGFGHFSEGFERPDSVELEVTITLLPFFESDGSVTAAAWDPVTVTLGPGPQPVITCVYLENTGHVGHPLFSTWRIDVIPRHGDGTPIHVPIDIDDVFYGCFGGAAPGTCATPTSGDGMNMLAFVNAFYQQGFYGLHVIDPAVVGPVPLLTSLVDRSIADPAWSPSGGRIAFTQNGDVAPIAHNLYLIAGDGAGLTQLTSGGNVWGFDWSPDGTRIAYSLGDDDSNADIWVLDLSGGAPVRLTDLGDAFGAVEPVWSPDGSRIVFERGTRLDGIYWDSDLYVMNADGSSPAPLVTTPPAAGPVNHSQSWSPDGTRIAYSSLYEDGGGVIWVVDVASGVQTSISSGVDEALSPTWSPATNEIAFFGYTGATGTDIWVVNADGTGLRSLGTDITWGSSIAWSADGLRLAYQAPSTNTTGDAIWVVDRYGAGNTQITNLAGFETDAAWSP